MSTPRPRVPLEEMKAALAASIDMYGLRPTARELGLSPMGTRRMADANTGTPYPQNLARLREWYWSFHMRRDLAVTEMQARAALMPLLLHLPLRRREAAFLRMMEALVGDTRRADVPVPDWLAGLLGGEADAKEEG